MVDFQTIIFSAVISLVASVVASLLFVRSRLRQEHVGRQELEGLDEVRKQANVVHRKLRRHMTYGKPSRQKNALMVEDMDLIEPFILALAQLTPRRRSKVRRRLGRIFGDALVDEVELGATSSGLGISLLVRGVNVDEYLYSQALQEPPGSAAHKRLEAELRELAKGR